MSSYSTLPLGVKCEIAEVAEELSPHHASHLDVVPLLDYHNIFIFEGGQFMNFNHVTIEKKWQKYWQENKTYKKVDDPSKAKFYALDMFPYPSGAGLHVGHPEGYTATDILSRLNECKAIMSSSNGLGCFRTSSRAICAGYWK